MNFIADAKRWFQGSKKTTRCTRMVCVNECARACVCLCACVRKRVCVGDWISVGASMCVLGVRMNG